MNGLPKIDYTTKEPDYIEVTSKFWNLMHKSPTGAQYKQDMPWDLSKLDNQLDFSLDSLPPNSPADI